MAAHAEGPVDVDGAEALEGRREQLEDPVAHDGDVAFLRRSSIGHGASLSRSCCSVPVVCLRCTGLV
ncbi:hypothetical protein GCM10009868_11760 [Terrabacter aerolatus]|uniref:Uncharacterized protein n=1 Tax=Terrabacter aerolatus TaxID=422442 RepID=A0A512CXU1_9MICO|nr:hypothetical protein TAE01_08420 [Terrabacter aerolatus]